MGLRVAVNQSAAQGRKTGVGFYAANLFRCLKEQARGDRIASFPPGWVEWVKKLGVVLRSGVEGMPPGRPVRKDTSPSAALSLARDVRRYLLWGYNYLAKRRGPWLSKRNFDLYHEPNFLAIPCDVPTVVTLHDLSVLLHPEWHPPERVALFEEHFPATLRQAVHFLTDSDFVRQEIVRTLGIPAGLVTRTYMGVRPNMRPLPAEQVARQLQQLGLPPRYLLYLGTLEPRKNVLRLMRAYCGLPDAVRARWPLLLVGGWGWKTEAIADYYHAEARHKGVRHLGYLEDEHLPVIYNGARALVFPSHYEGFGLPPVEMMACGGAVLASTAGTLVETLGSHAHLIDAEDADGWRDALARVTQDDDWWHFLRQGVTDLAKKFTWDRCAAETLQVYRLVCGKPAGRAEPVPQAA